MTNVIKQSSLVLLYNLSVQIILYWVACSTVQCTWWFANQIRIRYSGFGLNYLE